MTQAVPGVRHPSGNDQFQAPPRPDLFDGADARWVYAYAAAVAQRAADDLRAVRDRAGIAWAAANLITSAAEATGNPELRRAADGFRRAARAPWGRAPAARSPSGAMIRTQDRQPHRALVTTWAKPRRAPSRSAPSPSPGPPATTAARSRPTHRVPRVRLSFPRISGISSVGKRT
jgi:hypothetical protein